MLERTITNQFATQTALHVHNHCHAPPEQAPAHQPANQDTFMQVCMQDAGLFHPGHPEHQKKQHIRRDEVGRKPGLPLVIAWNGSCAADIQTRDIITQRVGAQNNPEMAVSQGLDFITDADMAATV